MQKPRPGRPKGSLNSERKQARHCDLYLGTELVDRIDRFATRARYTRTVAVEKLVALAFERMGELGLEI